MRKTAVIFCSASNAIDPKYNDEARRVIQCLCKHDIAIASGGTVKGTMAVVADEASRHSTGNIGVVPRFMADVLYPDLTELYWAESMAVRKEKMREVGKDYAIALPGGIGTFDEFFETYVLAKLNKYQGKVIAYNCYNYYDSLKALLDSFVESGMLDEHSRSLVAFPENIEELEKLL